MPKAILKTNTVEGFMGIPKYPIIAAVKSSGIKLGISEIIIIRKEINMLAIKKAIKTMANVRL